MPENNEALQPGKNEMLGGFSKSLEALSKNIGGFMEKVNEKIKPSLSIARDFFMKNSLIMGMAGFVPGMSEKLESFIAWTDKVIGNAKEGVASNTNEAKLDVSHPLVESMQQRLDAEKLLAYKSPFKSVGCADFVSYAVGFKTNRALLKNPNTNTAYVPSLVQEFRAQQFQEVTDPNQISYFMLGRKQMPLGSIFVFGNSYTHEDEDHIGVIAKDKNGKLVPLNNQGAGSVAIRSDIASIADAQKIRSRQEQFKTKKYSAESRDPVITKIFLPPVVA